MKVKKPTYTNLGSVRKYLREQQRVNGKPSAKVFDEIMRQLAKKKQEIDWRV
jgi:ribonucleotide monophosphatase NagD (HAD superfamily)